MPFAARAAPAATLRLAAIDWAMMETALMLGHPPVAACELLRYREDSAPGTLPATTRDLGLRGSPNLELLTLIRPDLILSSNFYARIEPQLARIAPVQSLTFYGGTADPLTASFDALSALADRIGDGSAGILARGRAEATLDTCAARLRSRGTRPVMLIDIGDARHFRAFGSDSLFGATLPRIGLTNAWTEKTRFSFNAPVPLDRLADMPEAQFVLSAPVPIEARDLLARSALWNALPAVRRGPVPILRGMNPFGGMPSALRFATALTEALETT